MILKSLKLINFRNINDLNLEFNKKINIFLGNNAQGKTNIIESIYFLSVAKSYRTRNDLNLVKNDKIFSKLSCSYQDENNDLNDLSIILNSDGKKVSINNIVQKKISNYVSKLNIVIFCPNDLEIITSSPSIRRKYLNIAISQINNNYLILLKDYNYLLKERNEYLKQRVQNKFNDEYFEILTKKMIEKEIDIIKKRYEFVNNLNKYLENNFKKIYGSEKLTMIYKSFLTKEEVINKDIDNIYLKYKKLIESEKFQKTTLIGCHKDDFELYLNSLNVCDFCSQGQQRIAILSLKLSEAETKINDYKIKPIILLDDIFSELDEEKKKNIFNCLNEKLQIFITTTNIDTLSDLNFKNAAIFDVTNGVVIRRNNNE